MTRGTLNVGPALDRVIVAQREDDAAVSYPRLQTYSHMLTEVCERLEGPMVWPVGSSAERLAGAAVVLSGGRVKTRGWNTDLTGQRVLLLTVTAVTPLGLLEAAEHARALGATEVYACGVRVEGLQANEVPEILEAFIPLSSD